MGNVVRFERATKGDTPRLTPNEIGMLVALVRSTACAVGKERDAYYAEILALTKTEDIRHLDREQLVPLVRHLHATTLAAIS